MATQAVAFRLRAQCVHSWLIVRWFTTDEGRITLPEITLTGTKPKEWPAQLPLSALKLK